MRPRIKSLPIVFQSQDCGFSEKGFAADLVRD